MTRLLLCQGCADAFADSLHVGEIQAAVGITWRADTHKGNVRRADCLQRVRSCVQSFRRDHFADQVTHSSFNNRAIAAVDNFHFGGIDIHTRNLVPFLRKARGRNTPDITQSKDTYSHLVSSGLEKRVNKWGSRRASQDDQYAHQERHDYDWQQPPLLVLSHEGDQIPPKPRIFLELCFSVHCHFTFPIFDREFKKLWPPVCLRESKLPVITIGIPG